MGTLTYHYQYQSGQYISFEHQALFGEQPAVGDESGSARGEKREIMSRKTINAILGLASVDQTFCQELLDNPLQAVQAKNFDLSREEQEIFKRISARDLYEFSQILLTLLDPQDTR